MKKFPSFFTPERTSENNSLVWKPGMPFFLREESLDELLQEGLRRENYAQASLSIPHQEYLASLTKAEELQNIKMQINNIFTTMIKLHDKNAKIMFLVKFIIAEREVLTSGDLTAKNDYQQKLEKLAQRIYRAKVSFESIDIDDLLAQLMKFIDKHNQSIISLKVNLLQKQAELKEKSNRDNMTVAHFFKRVTL